MVPSLVGTDFLLDPKDFPRGTGMHIPTVQRHRGGHGPWRSLHDHRRLAAGRPIGRLGTGAPPVKRRVSIRLSLKRPVKASSYLASERPGIWHVEPLNRNYLEKETVIAWKRPFEASGSGGCTSLRTNTTGPSISSASRFEGLGPLHPRLVQYPVRFDGEKP